jgi:ABC-type polysaccharide/polyol phosphate transport system ATPase subunit
MEMVQEAGTVVIVSHSFGMLSNICDRIVLMEKGKIIQEGDPSKVIQTYYNRAKKINKEGVE